MAAYAVSALVGAVLGVFAEGVSRRLNPLHAGQGVFGRRVASAAVGALYTVSVVASFGFVLVAPFLVLLGAVLLCLSLTDLDSRIIPNSCIAAGIFVWLAYVAALFIVDSQHAPFALTSGLIGAFAVGAGVLLLSLLMDKLLGRSSLGGGDIKLLFMVGLYLGGYASLINLIFACVLGALFAVVRPKKKGEDAHAFPFGPAISVATWITLLYGAVF